MLTSLLAIACAAMPLLAVAQPPPPAPAPAPLPDAAPAPLPEVVVSRDDTIIDRSCRIRIDPGRLIRDLNANGVIHVAADDIVVEFAPGAVLRGAVHPMEPDTYTGVGIVIDGHRGVTLRGASVRGYRCGILATAADGLTIEDCRLTDLFRQRLRSSREAEDPADWLWPHDNDSRQWVTAYGAAICLERSRHATVRRCTVRQSQNGLLLDRTDDSAVYDNDFSFLSGWGLALWRSSGNAITRNALDFCIRGYSHGVYNRGQDSAGILLFEQCGSNLIAENSATHGGDGLFLFAGKQALGQAPAPADASPDWHAGRGCNDNLIINNDFSYAAAHGIEATFSFGNRLVGNRLVEDAICGVWGGYSQRMLVQGNTIERNGRPESSDGTRGEGGGVNIEHGADNLILHNAFRGNSVAVALWDDDDPGLLDTPWARANHRGSRDNTIASNTFDGDRVAIRLTATSGTRLGGNTMTAVGREILADAASVHSADPDASPIWVAPAYTALGDTTPVGARHALAGRDRILMTEWGPWDHESPLVRLVERGVDGDAYEVLGATRVQTGQPSKGTRITDRAPTPPAAAAFLVSGPDGAAHSYQLFVDADGQRQTVRGTTMPTRWHLRVFPWSIDPRQGLDAWRREADAAAAVTLSLAGPLRLPLGNGGPRAIDAWRAEADRLPGPSRYGIIATTSLRLPRGKWRFRCTSDDGVRVTVNADPRPRPAFHAVVIENWTHHAPTVDTGELDMPETGTAEIRVEYFQIDGFATLELSIESVPSP
jgi:parallel beta-helix repeat protein